MTQPPVPQQDARATNPQDSPLGAKMLRSEDLFAGQRMIVIQHAGAQYRLLITRNDRLILQK